MPIQRPTKPMQLILVRHGLSQWNKENRFTGWWDVPLIEEGIQEAKAAGRQLLKHNYEIDIAYTSVLRRAVVTYNHICDEMDLYHVPIKRSWRLNERHYGGLTGLDKAETAEKHGVDKVMEWRRSYDIKPPAMDIEDERAPHYDVKYKHVCKKILPLTESLKDTQKRVFPFFFDEIVMSMMKGKKVMVVAHGNSLRSIVKFLENIGNEEITGLNIPTGIPLVYELDVDLNILDKRYLADEEELDRKVLSVANQANKK